MLNNIFKICNVFFEDKIAILIFFAVFLVGLGVTSTLVFVLMSTKNLFFMIFGAMIPIGFILLLSCLYYIFFNEE